MGNAQKKSIIDALNNPQNDAKLRNAFNQYDTDKSGTLTLDEFEKFTDDFFKILLSVTNASTKDFEYDKKVFALALFDMTGTDKSGTVTFEEFKSTIQINSAVELCEKMFQSVVAEVGAIATDL